MTALGISDPINASTLVSDSYKEIRTQFRKLITGILGMIYHFFYFSLKK